MQAPTADEISELSTGVGSVPNAELPKHLLTTTTSSSSFYRIWQLLFGRWSYGPLLFPELLHLCLYSVDDLHLSDNGGETYRPPLPPPTTYLITPSHLSEHGSTSTLRRPYADHLSASMASSSAPQPPSQVPARPFPTSNRSESHSSSSPTAAASQKPNE
jgi:hypothetical protein